MKSQTSLVAKQVRIQQWAELIKDCQSRPEGMKVETWCELQGITKSNYYYKLRQVRKACLKQVQNKTPEFIELPKPTSCKHEDTLFDNQKSSSDAVAILRGPNNMSIELLSTATSDFLNALIGAFSHVE
jgi:hypothetical protein